MAENVTPEGTEQVEGNGWRRFFTTLLPYDQRTLIGTVVFFAIILMIGWVGVNEPARMASFTTQYEARAIMRGAALFRSNCTGCHGINGEGLPGVAPAINTPAMFDGQRLAEVGWAGTLYDYIELTISAGRPVMSQPYPQPMPTWGQDYGGPLRPDQVEDLVAFVLNWGRQYEEGAQPVAGIPTPLPTPTPSFTVVGDDPSTELPAGDAARGEALFQGTAPGPDGAVLACNACHSIDGTLGAGPSVQGLLGRIPDGYASADAYVHESIVQPCAYVREGFDCLMPQNYGTERLDAQTLADLIAYVLQVGQ